MAADSPLTTRMLSIRVVVVREYRQTRIVKFGYEMMPPPVDTHRSGGRFFLNRPPIIDPLY